MQATLTILTSCTQACSARGCALHSGMLQCQLTAAPLELWLSLVSLMVKGMTQLESVMKIQTITDVGLLWWQS